MGVSDGDEETQLTILAGTRPFTVFRSGRLDQLPRQRRVRPDSLQRIQAATTPRVALCAVN